MLALGNIKNSLDHSDRSRREVTVRYILPPSEDHREIDFDELECIPQGPECNITDDKELDMDVIEVIGEDSRVIFPVRGDLPYLAMHLKTINRFVTIILTLRDNTETVRHVTLTNRRSNIRIDKNSCSLPIEMGDGWQHLCLPLNDICFNAFGSRCRYCAEIIITGSVRIGRIFFEEEMYADVELPPNLRVVK